MKKELIDSAATDDRSLALEKIHKNTYDALDSLVIGSYLAQQTFPISSDELYYWKEFCTVKMCVARRSGHTTAMCKIAQKYFNSAIFLSPTMEISNNLYKGFAALYEVYDDDFVYLKKRNGTMLTRDGEYFFGSYKSLNKFRGIDCEAVFIDPSCFLRPKETDEIYEILGPCMQNYPQKFFIFIG